ncbi:hypothetical protein F2P81_012572 [Scophthalmus maximus]|uniref:Uncharacterized protein n=1 Tax=Scophthalmus maximus TaxID=52904 RepID=A0A6A4SUT0_SCOMX|nr:hypothetical protein F2P81_012572 [Scophthalmus maximus]
MATPKNNSNSNGRRNVTQWRHVALSKRSKAGIQENCSLCVFTWLQDKSPLGDNQVKVEISINVPKKTVGMEENIPPADFVLKCSMVYVMLISICLSKLTSRTSSDLCGLSKELALPVS